jgi:hypothetical protein
MAEPNVIIFDIDKADRKRIEIIKESNILDFSNSSNAELFLFAVSLGLQDNERIPLSSHETFLRYEYLHDNEEALLLSIAIQKFEDLDIVSSLNHIVDLAQELAHYGFIKLEHIVSGGSLELIENEFINEVVNRVSGLDMEVRTL